jgi:RNA polymerase sigma-70 factor (ECF subfamily)
MTVTVENIWHEFSAKLRQFIRGRVSDDATADDILQDIFLKIQTRLGQLEDSSRLQSWIFLMARNAVIDHYRTRKETVEVPVTLIADEPGDDVDIEELQAAFRRMIDELPEPYREAIVLTELEGLTQKELAERLGISLSGAKSRVQRGREQLKQTLLDCCKFEFDRRGRVIDCSPRSQSSCPECS